MLSVLLIWGFLFITTVLTGLGGIHLLGRFCREKTGERSLLQASVAGLVIVTVYAECFSLFGGVRFLAVFLLSLICAGIFVWLRREGVFHAMAEDVLPGPRKAALTVFAVLLFAYGTSRGILHTDTTLYHAQAIRWIEEFGAVKGLGVFHTRLGYNSAAFPLTALYSFSFTGQSFHVTAGYVALLCFLECMKVFPFMEAGRKPGAQAASLRQPGRVSDFARLAALLYLAAIFDEMVSPASDYFMVCLVFYILIRFLSLWEQGDRYGFSHGLLLLLAVFAVSVKYSAAPFLLLTAFPACVLWKRNRKAVPVFLAAGAGILLPFLLRNILLTGYLLYPYPSLDLFRADWKIPAARALADAQEIRAWAKGFTDAAANYVHTDVEQTLAAMADAPLSVWFGKWFLSQPLLYKAAFLAALLSVPAMLFVGVRALREKKREEVFFLFVYAVCLCGLAFWFFSAPLFRYGVVFVYLTAAVAAGILFRRLPVRPALKNRLFPVLLALFLLWKGAGLAVEQKNTFENRYWLLQKPYDDPPCAEEVVDGVSFWFPKNGGGTGYAAFPSAPYRADFSLRGKTLRKGFRTQ